MGRFQPRRFQRNVASNYALVAASVLVALVTTPVLVHALGKSGFGIWALVGSMVWYLPLLEFGFGGATVKYIAEHDARGDVDSLRRTIATSFWVLCLPALAALALGGALAAAFPLLFDVPADLERAAQILVLLVTVDIALSMPMDTFGNTLVGLQRYDLLNLTLVIVMLAQAAAWIAIAEAGGGLVALGVASLALSVPGQLARYAIARRESPAVTISPRFVDRRLLRPFASLSGWLFLTTLSKLVIRRLDVVVVGLVVGVPEAAVYAVGQKLAFLADQAVLPITRIFFPHASAVSARDPGPLGETMRWGTRIVLAVGGPVCLALALLATPAVRAWVGSGYDDAALVVVFLAGTTAVRSLTHVGLQMLPGTGRARVPALVSAGEAGLNLTLSVVLGSAIGLEGVALATLIAATLAHLGVLLPYVCREFRVPLGSLAASLLRAHLPAAGAAAVVGFALLESGLSGLPAVVAAGAAIVITYLAVFAFTGLGAADRRRLVAPLRARLFGSVPGG